MNNDRKATDFSHSNEPLSAQDLAAGLSLGQGIFYLTTGVWPLVSLRTFELVTGPKTDKWLVKTAGVLITAIGSALTLAGLQRKVSAETQLLAVLSAAGLTAIDVIYVAKRRIAPVYLLDAAAELAIISCWLALNAPPTEVDKNS